MSNVTVREIVEIVADVFNVDPLQLNCKSGSNSRQVGDARRVAMYLSDRHTRLTADQLATVFGKSVLSSSLKAVRADIRTFAEFRPSAGRELSELVEACERQIDEAHEANSARETGQRARRLVRNDRYPRGARSAAAGETVRRRA